MNGNTTQLSALLFVNAAGETVPVLEHSAPFNLTCSNVPATNLTECLLFPAAVRTVNRRFDDSNPNLTLRATFSFEMLSNLRDTEDVVVASGLTIVDDEGEGTASSSRTAVIVAVCVVGGVGLLLLIGAAVYVVMRRGAAAKDAVSQLSPAVQIPNSNGENLLPCLTPCSFPLLFFPTPLVFLPLPFPKVYPAPVKWKFPTLFILLWKCFFFFFLTQGNALRTPTFRLIFF